MYNYRRVSNLFLDVANLKYAMHLKNFGSDFDRALQRIKVCVHEEQAIINKKQNYAALWDLSIEACSAGGMNPQKLKTLLYQFNHRESTLKQAIRELENAYGIVCVDRKLGDNGKRIVFRNPTEQQRR